LVFDPPCLFRLVRGLVENEEVQAGQSFSRGNDGEKGVTMIRHWLIHSFFVGLLLLCVGGWVWSAACQFQLCKMATPQKGMDFHEA